jgi:glycosyltransferase involved in cell wall biosynthesis
MRILVIHNQLWAHYKSKLFSEINNSLQELHPESDFLVIHIAFYEKSRTVMQDEGCYQYTYPFKVLFNKSLDEVGFKERLESLIAEFDSYKPTVLNVTGWFDWAQVILMIYARFRGVRIVLSSESSSADQGRSGFKEKIKSRIVNLADAFFCFGKTSADYLLSLGVKNSQIAVSNAAVIDEDVIRSNYTKAKADLMLHPASTAGKRNFIFVGRLAAEKNLNMLIDAFVNVREHDKQDAWNLLFVGDGPVRADLEKQASGSGIPGSIHFTGGFPWYKIPGWLAKSDVLVLPSKSEPWGLVVNEAMVCGMPVVVSKNCGCAEDLVKEGLNGFTFDPENRSGLEDKLRFFIQNPDKITSMGDESQVIIQRFSSKKVAREMVHCYHKL